MCKLSVQQNAVNVASECDCVCSHTGLNNLISSFNNHRLLTSTLIKLGPLQRNWFIDFFVHAFSYHWSFNQQETKQLGNCLPSELLGWQDVLCSLYWTCSHASTFGKHGWHSLAINAWTLNRKDSDHLKFLSLWKVLKLSKWESRKKAGGKNLCAKFLFLHDIWNTWGTGDWWPKHVEEMTNGCAINETITLFPDIWCCRSSFPMILFH